MTNLTYQPFYRRRLPHIQPPGATLFVTFRLADSIPVQVQMQLHWEARQLEATIAQIQDPQERARRAYLEQRRLFGRWDAVLDAARSGPCWLRDPQIAALVSESLHYRDGRVYNLDTFCIMPNYVHAIFTPLLQADGVPHALAVIMQSLKGYIARQANLLLGRQGSFWQHESYDHIVRDEEEWQRIRAYVLNNPVKAGLVSQWQEWPWTYCKHPM